MRYKQNRDLFAICSLLSGSVIYTRESQPHIPYYTGYSNPIGSFTFLGLFQILRFRLGTNYESLFAGVCCTLQSLRRFAMEFVERKSLPIFCSNISNILAAKWGRSFALQEQ